MNITFVGPKIQDLGGFTPNAHQKQIRTTILSTLSQLILDKTNVVLLTGLSLGIEWWAADSARSLKIPYKVYLPFDNVDSKWPHPTRMVFKGLCGVAHEIVSVDTGEFSVQKLHKREQFVIDLSDRIYSFYPGPNPISAYANKKGKELINLLGEETEDDGFYITI